MFERFQIACFHCGRQHGVSKKNINETRSYGHKIFSCECGSTFPLQTWRVTLRPQEVKEKVVVKEVKQDD